MDGGGRPRLQVPDKGTRSELFRRIDYNGNGGLSLAEIDKAVVELYPEFNHKPSLMRAYKAADISGDGFIQRKEFAKLLHYLVYFNNVWHLFEQIDTDGDRRLDLAEFIQGCAVVGIEGMGLAELEGAFGDIDGNGGGFVLFDEFCSWCAAQHCGEAAAEPQPRLVQNSKRSLLTKRSTATRPGGDKPTKRKPSPRYTHAVHQVKCDGSAGFVQQLWSGRDVLSMKRAQKTRAQAFYDYIMAAPVAQRERAYFHLASSGWSYLPARSRGRLLTACRLADTELWPARVKEGETEKEPVGEVEMLSFYLQSEVKAEPQVAAYYDRSWERTDEGVADMLSFYLRSVAKAEPQLAAYYARSVEGVAAEGVAGFLRGPTYWADQAFLSFLHSTGDAYAEDCVYVGDFVDGAGAAVREDEGETGTDTHTLCSVVVCATERQAHR